MPAQHQSRARVAASTMGSAALNAGFADLCTAIVHRACLDYLMALQGRDTMRGSSTGPAQHIEKFFRSAWFHYLSDADGEALILALRRIAESGQISIAYLTKIQPTKEERYSQ